MKLNKHLIALSLSLSLSLSLRTTFAYPIPAGLTTSSSTTGFVKTTGQKFSLDGAPFAVVGSNSYWVGLSGLGASDIETAFVDIAKTGATTVRTWGFNEVTSNPGVAYYQIWDGNTPTINTGSDGLQNFDNVVAAAKASGLRLIVALTNNWEDFGGMDVYVKQILNSDNHDLFYTDDSVKAAYKNYVKTFVERYANEPTIMAWELANEPRCTGSKGVSTGSCTTETITNWAREMAAFVKSIDQQHLVGLGDEGFFNQPGSPLYPYQGGEGIDFDANLAIADIDFGTVHLYPTHWGQGSNTEGFGNQWIADHLTSQQKAGKPVILEEFGTESNQASVYTSWLGTIVSSGLGGDLIWQAGSHLSIGDTHDDGFTVFPESDVYPVLTEHAAAMKARS